MHFIVYIIDVINSPVNNAMGIDWFKSSRYSRILYGVHCAEPQTCVRTL